MSDSDFKIAVIGLGIIGGSMAFALKGFKNAYIVGCDTDAQTRKKAFLSGAVSEAFENASAAIENADLVVMCLYPDYIIPILSSSRSVIKRDAIITDVCGVKKRLAENVSSIIPTGVEYISGHPMAGRETDGFESADKDMFSGCGYIITPMHGATERGIATVRDMAKHIGAKMITEAGPALHDEIIAYTSDLMHISASALCLSFNQDMNLAYAAGAFRDCTRIANINPELWSELFLENKNNVLSETDRLINSLSTLRGAIEKEDKQQLKKLLERVRQNKLEMQKRKV